MISLRAICWFPRRDGKLMHLLSFLASLITVVAPLLTNAVDLPSISGRGPQISDLNLLLPPRTSRPVHYTLEGINGCFTWSWDHEDLLSVEPQVNASTPGCSTSAIITSIAPYEGRRATAVRATDTITGQVLRCEVFIDKISKIRIFHHSLKLDLDGLTTLQIRAFDEEDDIFSSLGSLEFAWELSPEGPSGGPESVPHRLIHVPLEDSSLRLFRDDFRKLELEHNGGLYVVRGINAGREKVTARLLEPTLDRVAHSVVLTVAEAFSLEPPSPVLVIPGTSVQYTLKTLRNTRASVVQLPSPNYVWSSDNSSVAAVDSAKGFATGHLLGSTIIRVTDIRVAGHEQTSSLHVVTPVALRLSLFALLPRRDVEDSKTAHPVEAVAVPESTRWQLVVGRDYVVQVNAYSLEVPKRPIMLTQDNDLRIALDNEPTWTASPLSEGEALVHGWRNASLVKAKQEGRGVLLAVLRHGQMQPKEDAKTWTLQNVQELRAEQQVQVCTPVKILKGQSAPGSSDAKLRLPWLPGHFQGHTLVATGGCGGNARDYQWQSLNPKIATVTPRGVVHGREPGVAQIRVAAMQDRFNFDLMEVEVTLPGAVRAVPSLPVEAELHSLLTAAVVLEDPSGYAYDSCSAIGPLVRWQLQVADMSGKPPFVILNTTSMPTQTGPASAAASSSATAQSVLPPAGDSCAWAILRAESHGRAAVTAILDLAEILGKREAGESQLPPTLEDSWQIAAYLPLTVEQAGDGKGHGGYGLSSLWETSSIKRVPAEAGFPGGRLLLAMGSKMTVRVTGGPERWRPGSEYLDSGKLERDLEQESSAGSSQVVTRGAGIRVEHHMEDGGRLYSVTCLRLGSYVVGFSRGNLAGTGHQVAHSELTVICAIPHSVVLLVDESGNHPSAIAASADVIRSENRVHLAPLTVINGRTIRVAAAALDAGNTPFANASSLALQWQLKGCDELAHWASSGDLESQSEAGPWERALVLTDVPGECILRAFVKTDHLQPAREDLTFADYDHHVATSILSERSLNLSDTVPLQLLKALRVQPEAALLLLHPDATVTFTVIGGTTDVQPSVNDTRVAAVLPDGVVGGKEAQLTVRAVGLGTAAVTVRDIGLATPAEATALVTVAEVAKLSFYFPEDAYLLPEEAFLQLRSTVTVLLRAEDSQGRVFDPSQYAMMGVEVHLQDDVLQLVGLGSEGGAHPANSVRLQGGAVGLTTTFHVSVKTYSGRKVYSDFARVSVYAPLSIQPASLVLAPGADYVVEVSGGPRTGAVLHFWGSNDTVAAVPDATVGRLVARAIGNMTVSAQAVGQDGSTLSQASVPVRVHIPEAMGLSVRGARIGVGREVSVFPLGSLEGEDLLSFGQLCGGYKWSSSDPKILSVEGEQGDEEPANDSAAAGQLADSTAEIDTGFSVRLSGRTAGSATVSLAFQCHFPKPAGGALERVYKASETIWVVPDPPLALGLCATWLLPLHYTSSVLLPSFSGAPSTGSRRGAAYSLMQVDDGEPPMAALESGQVRTFERPDVACIRAREASTGRTEVAACVRTAEVAQLTIGNEVAPFHSSELSVGATAQLGVTLRDSLGAPFYEAWKEGEAMVVESNHPDVVAMAVLSVEKEKSSSAPLNLTLALQAKRQGVALLRVRLRKSLPVFDFLVVQVGAYVSPRMPSVHMGTHINFTVSSRAGQPGGVQRERGRWSSSNEKVLQIDPSSGEAVAVGEGTATVSFNSSRLSSSTSVTVLRLASLRVGPPLEARVLSNSPLKQQEGYMYPVSFSTPTRSRASSKRDTPEVAYECQVEPSYLGAAKPWRDAATQSRFCLFFPRSPESLHSALARGALEDQGDEGGRLRMAISAVVTGLPDVKGRAEATFVGGFAILDAPAQVSLSPSSNRSRLTVVGNVGALRVEWGRRDVLLVQRDMVAPSRGIAGKAVFTVKVVQPASSFVDVVTFLLPATGQEEEIRVAYEAGRGIPIPIHFFPTAAFTIFIATALGFLFFLVTKVYDTRSRAAQAPPPQVAPATPSTPAAQVHVPNGLYTPSPASLPRSPPQPYTDYVSRTIDRTPYYSRDGLSSRRIDPSHTY